MWSYQACEYGLVSVKPKAYKQRGLTMQNIRTKDIKNGSYPQDEVMAEFKRVIKEVEKFTDENNIPPRSMLWRLRVLSDKFWESEQV